MSDMERTEILKASELAEKVMRPIFETRFAEEVKAYEKALAKYNRRRAGRPEVNWSAQGTYLGIPVGEKVKTYGFITKTWREDVEIIGDGNGGKVMVVARPKKPNGHAWGYSKYWRSGEDTFHARQSGLLADPKYNRDIRPAKVFEYIEIMEAGKWHDLLSDPISITEDGDVVNGQHRLAAVSEADWEKAGHDPRFLVVWGVAPAEALLADHAKRSGREQAVIGTRVVHGMQPMIGADVGEGLAFSGTSPPEPSDRRGVARRGA